MRILHYLTASLPLFLLNACATHMPLLPAGSAPSVASIMFVQPETQSEFRPEEFRFTLNELEFVINDKGQGMVLPASGVQSSFTLPMPADHFLEGFYYAPYQSDLLLYYQLHDGHYLSAGVARLDYTQNKLKWNTAIPGFNIGEPLLYQSKLYVTAHGFVGKLDVENGGYDWRHEGLYRNDAYNAFLRPRVTQGNVYFVEISSIREGDDAYYIAVNDKTGRIRVSAHKQKPPIR